MLDVNNYAKGFLIDDEWMAGITADADKPGHFLAFVMDHAAGEYVDCTLFPNLDAALSAINSLKRNWKYESTSGCGEGKCGSSEKCGSGECPKVQAKQASHGAKGEDCCSH